MSAPERKRRLGTVIGRAVEVLLFVFMFGRQLERDAAAAAEQGAPK